MAGRGTEGDTAGRWTPADTVRMQKLAAAAVAWYGATRDREFGHRADFVLAEAVFEFISGRTA